MSIYKKIDTFEKTQFTMPLSLRLIKETASEGIDWKGLHIADLYSIIYSIRIDKAKRYLEEKRRERLQQRGIAEVKQATAQDFDNL
jgi:hypothetical protein